MEDSRFNFKEFNYLPDFEFPVACNDICISENKRKLLAVGIYKPSVRLFDFKAATLKFERHIVCDPLKILSLHEDAEKFCILRNDRTVEFHLKSGSYEQMKIPKQPSDIVFNHVSSELYIGGAFLEIQRFNFEQGRFMKGIPCLGASKISFSNIHGLICATSKSTLSFFDSRMKEEVFSREYENEILCNDMDKTGLKYCIGCENGDLIEYDFRSGNPIRKIENEGFISKIRYHNKNIIFSASNTLNILTDQLSEVEKICSGFLINTFDFDDGVIFVGGENTALKGYCSQKLGKMPSWFADISTVTH